ncbi:hypothetical protein ACOIOT_000773 [Cronobacter turicensis]
MNCFKVIILLLFSVHSSHAMDFKLVPANEVEGVKYFSLYITNKNKVKNIDIALEGNSDDIKIKQSYALSCDWGDVFGVRLNMDSASADGKLIFNNVYFFDNELNLIFAKSFSSTTTWLDPFSLKNSVCNHVSNGLKIDPVTNKEYVVDFEDIQQGPFILKGSKNVSIKYVRGEILNFIREDENGELIVDKIENYHNMAPSVCAVFFMNVNSQFNVVSLISWGSKNKFYKVYAYTYDKEGLLFVNEKVAGDTNLSGYDKENQPFQYKKAAAIKRYLIQKYSL